MDSSAIYIDARSDLVGKGDLRYQLAACERRAFVSGRVSDMMQWKWCDYVTGDTLAPAFDEPPELPELSKWLPTDSKTTWDDVPDVEFDTFIERVADSVMVYQYA
jgi:hypothetical protein